MPPLYHTCIVHKYEGAGPKQLWLFCCLCHELVVVAGTGAGVKLLSFSNKMTLSPRYVCTLPLTHSLPPLPHPLALTHRHLSLSFPCLSLPISLRLSVLSPFLPVTDWGMKDNRQKRGQNTERKRNREQEDESAKSIPAGQAAMLQGLKDDVCSTLEQEFGSKVSFTSALSATQPSLNVAAAQQFKLTGLRSAPF